MGSPVTHFEIQTKQPEKVQKFFKDLFDWNIQVVPPGYGLVDTKAGRGINGGIGGTNGGPNRVTFYMEVDNPQTYLDEAQKLGGKIVMPVTTIPSMVTFALFSDPDGNVVGVVKSEQRQQQALESLKLSTVLSASPERIYKAWLSGKEHTSMTGGKATASTRVGGKFTAWDGHIRGTNLELEPSRRILQSWRTTEFPRDAADSKLEVALSAVKGGTRLTLVHTKIPAGLGKEYREGWPEHYFTPMKKYFSSNQK